MARYTLTVLDTLGIQPYIFGSNRLKENIGASELVERATHQWAYEALPPPNNGIQAALGTLDDTKRIEAGPLKAEVVYAGGGNTVILFISRDEAKDFTKRLTSRVLQEAPGLEVLVAHREFDWDTESLADTVMQTIQSLAQKKQERQPSAPVLGLGVTAACQSTGLVAIGTNEPYRPPQESEVRLISAEIEARLTMAEHAQGRLNTLLSNLTEAGYETARDFDDFGSPGEENYIAVVHADGNGIGQRVEAIGKSYHDPGQNRDYIQAMRRFSASVADASTRALRSAADLLLRNLDPHEPRIRGEVRVRGRKMPFRPLVFGGDDVTFVCDGRLGLALAAHYLAIFESQPLSDSKVVHACTGIAVVKTHYPFARAYALADELCHSAKGRVRERRKGDQEDDFSALDWHFSMTGLAGSLATIRDREYRVPGESRLCMRPVRLQSHHVDWRSWPTFKAMVVAFQADPAWAGRRNKVVRMRMALRGGRAPVRQFLRDYRFSLPVVPEHPYLAEEGWHGGLCAYFDAIEAMDFFLPLE